MSNKKVLDKAIVPYKLGKVLGFHNSRSGTITGKVVAIHELSIPYNNFPEVVYILEDKFHGRNDVNHRYVFEVGLDE